jgi:hypothetical protein
MNGPLVPLHGPVRSELLITELYLIYPSVRCIDSRDVPKHGVGKCPIAFGEIQFLSNEIDQDSIAYQQFIPEVRGLILNRSSFGSQYCRGSAET